MKLSACQQQLLSDLRAGADLFYYRREYGISPAYLHKPGQKPRTINCTTVRVLKKRNLIEDARSCLGTVPIQLTKLGRKASHP